MKYVDIVDPHLVRQAGYISDTGAVLRVVAAHRSQADWVIQQFGQHGYMLKPIEPLNLSAYLGPPIVWLGIFRPVSYQLVFSDISDQKLASLVAAINQQALIAG